MSTNNPLVIGNANAFLDFEKNKVQTLSLDQLRRTHKENDVYGNPLKGVYHYELIERLSDIANNHNFDVEIYDMFAAQNKDRNTPGVVILPQVEQQMGEKAVEAHILRRVFTNIRLKDFDDDTYTTNLAVAFHQGGIQVGFGNMVKICHNQCMLNANHYISTYSEKGQGRGNGSTLDEIYARVDEWMTNAGRSVMNERSKIEQMKSITLTAEQIFIIIGMLTAIRVKCDSHIKEIRENRQYPLNSSQINLFTEMLLKKQYDNDRISVWDLYNTATELYKADSADIPALLPQNRAMVSFLSEQFSL